MVARTATITAAAAAATLASWAGIGCSTADGGKCGAARGAASAAVADYVDTALRALDDSKDADAELARWKRLDDEITTIGEQRAALVCAPITGLARRKQPAPAAMDDTLIRGSTTADVAGEVLGAHELDPAVETAAGTARTELERQLGAWKSTVSSGGVVEGRAWSPAARAYLAGVETAWCDLTERLAPALGDVLRDKQAEHDKLRKVIDRRTNTRTQRQAKVEQTLALRQALADGARAIETPPELDKDPDFARARSAIRTVNQRCTSRGSKPR